MAATSSGIVSAKKIVIRKFVIINLGLCRVGFGLIPIPAACHGEID